MNDEDELVPAGGGPIEMVSDIVAAYVSHNSLPSSELPRLIEVVSEAINTLRAPPAPAVEEAAKVTPAQIRKSITPDFLTSFLDGRSYKSLKRHLTKHGLTPDEYRSRFGLPRDYPMVAPNYAAQRSELAKSLGLGRGRRTRAPLVTH